MELSDFDVVYKSIASIKSQALANFIAKFVNALDIEMMMELVEPFMWNLFVDGSSRETGAKARVLLGNLEGISSTVQ